MWVAKPNSIKDLVWYWNLRALRHIGRDEAPMVLLPDRGVENWVDFGRQFEQQLGRQVDGDPDVVIGSLGVPVARLKDIASILGLRPSEHGYKPNSIRFPAPPRREAPFTYLVNLDVRREVVFDRSYGQRTATLAQIYPDETIVDLDCAFAPKLSGHTLARLSGSAFRGLPKHEAVANAILRHATWLGDDLQIATNLYDRYNWTLKIPTIEEAVWLALRDSHPVARLSDKGRLAGAVEDTLGSAALADVGAFDVIRHLTTRRSAHRVRAIDGWHAEGRSTDEIERLTRLTFGRTERRFCSVADISGELGSGAAAAAEMLANRGYVERGFVIACSTCAITSFVELVRVDGPATCPACQSRTVFECGIGPTVHYRLHGLVDRASDQGALLHLKVRRQLLDSSVSGFVLPGVELDGSEVDLFGVLNGELIAGEVKHSAGAFTTDQINRDLAVSSRLGAAMHVAGCADQLPADLVEQIASVAASVEIGLVVCDPTGVRRPRDS
ncbi:MAG: hypothetical protein QM733_23725 [Ilumatobacteraceae bacterium]